jgi:hypothetical protein
MRKRRRRNVVIAVEEQCERTRSVPCNAMDVETDFFNETSYQATDDFSVPVYADVPTHPCANCGRSFNAESLVSRAKGLRRNVSPLL